MKMIHALATAFCFCASNFIAEPVLQAAEAESQPAESKTGKTPNPEKGQFPSAAPEGFKYLGEVKELQSANALTEAEKKFQETLANCVFQGRWCLVKDGQLGEEREEKYTILRASKTSGSNWLIFARVQYGQKDVMVPIPVQVKWAGDTPVITLDNMAIPSLGTYSARVVVHNNTYAGTWSGGEHGGMLHGVIEKSKPTQNSDQKPK